MTTIDGHERDKGMYFIVLIDGERIELFRVAQRIKMAHAEAHFGTTFARQPEARDVLHLGKLFAISDMPLVKQDVQTFFFGSFRAGTDICHRATFEGKGSRMENGIFPDFE